MDATYHQQIDATTANLDRFEKVISQLQHLNVKALSLSEASVASELKEAYNLKESLEGEIEEQIQRLYDPHDRRLRERFSSLLRAYGEQDLRYRRSREEGVERRCRMFDPDVTQEQIGSAVAADRRGENVYLEAVSVPFLQCCSNNEINGFARKFKPGTTAASEVRNEVGRRHRDIQTIETDMTFLGDAYQKLGLMVEEQGRKIPEMEGATARTVQDCERGTGKIKKGIRRTRSRKKLKWSVSIIVGMVLIFLVILTLKLTGIIK